MNTASHQITNMLCKICQITKHGLSLALFKNRLKYPYKKGRTRTLKPSISWFEPAY